MQENNDNSLALAMTNTWFSMLPQDLKEKYLKDFDLYSKAFIDVYGSAEESIRKKKSAEQEEVSSFFVRGGSLEGRIK